MAAENPPPPPPPTEREVAEALVRQQEEEERARRASVATREAFQWGGRPPTDELRDWGAPAAQLAHQDRALVDELAMLTPARQRRVALWAARRACERAGVLDHPSVVDALRRADRDEPLPEAWQEWSSAWDAVYPPEPGEVVESILTVHVGPAYARPAAPEMAAVGAVMALGDPHPGRAVTGTVDYLRYSVTDVQGCLAEVREALALLVDEG